VGAPFNRKAPSAGEAGGSFTAIGLTKLRGTAAAGFKDTAIAGLRCARWQVMRRAVIGKDCATRAWRSR
jgi:hypothetical protein